MEIKFNSVKELFDGVAQIAHQFGYIVHVVDTKVSENSIDSGSIDSGTTTTLEEK